MSVKIPTPAELDQMNQDYRNGKHKTADLVEFFVNRVALVLKNRYAQKTWRVTLHASTIAGDLLCSFEDIDTRLAAASEAGAEIIKKGFKVEIAYEKTDSGSFLYFDIQRTDPVELKTAD